MTYRPPARLGAGLVAAALAVVGLAAPGHAGGRSSTPSGVSGATLVVRAVDAVTGAPVNGFCATMTPIDGNACDDGAQVTLTGLAAEPASVFVTTGPASDYLSSEAVPVTLVEGETTTVTVPLTLGGRISAAVVDRITGQPVADACIALAVPGRGVFPDGCERTDEQGRVITNPQPVGTYQMFVYTPEGYGYQWAGLSGGTGDQREAARIRVRAARVTQAPTARLDPSGTISGVVRDPAGAPAPGVRVGITAWGLGSGPTSDVVTTGEQGGYALDRLGPYSWPLNFTPVNELPRQWSGGVANRFRAETIRVRAGEATTYDMGLVRGAGLRGTVTVRGGAAVDSWTLIAVNAATGDAMGRADSADAADRTYEMPLVGGQQVKIRWFTGAGSGWWENATDITTAGRVPVPRSRFGTQDLTIG
ncbi:carboxypeptidase-like regulatory domain-containing protein [Actinoplanes sp. GCM10030250]|uniref:carboxypeptidase-like regulatory domain-containing protein n=1 Tax=Actinoplanes sp. GCM10030250 TaxID=3273376 RepID=UPI00360A9728